MSTRASFGRNLAARARKIGWQVDALDGGWVITCPDNFRVQLHATPSDVNAEPHAIQELNRHGFAEAEMEFSRLSEDNRQERLAAVREESQRRLDAAQKQADALAKAAGQSRVPEEFLINPYPVPKTFERVLVTPELAQKLLGLNTANRPLRPAEVDFWKEVIDRGAWHYTHQGVAIDSTGVLQDGQHRLGGIVKANIAVELQVSVGMPPENFNAIDNGLRRTFGDVATRLGIVSSQSKVGSVARLLVIYNEYPVRSFSQKVSNAEVADFLSRTLPDGSLMAELVHDAVNEAQAHWASYRINTSSAATVVVKLWEIFGKDDPRVVAFLTGLKVGASLPDDDVRLCLRRYMSAPPSKRVRSATMHLGYMLKAWNKFVQNKPTKVLTYKPKVEDMPKIFIPGTSDKKRG